jgi:hypothetical protein
MLSLQGLWQLWQRQGLQQKLALYPPSSLVSLVINLGVLERESKHALAEDCMHHIIFMQVTQASLSVWRYEIAPIPSLRAVVKGGNWCKIGLTHSDSKSQSYG